MLLLILWKHTIWSHVFAPLRTKINNNNNNNNNNHVDYSIAAHRQTFWVALPLLLICQSFAPFRTAFGGWTGLMENNPMIAAPYLAMRSERLSGCVWIVEGLGRTRHLSVTATSRSQYELDSSELLGHQTLGFPLHFVVLARLFLQSTSFSL